MGPITDRLDGWVRSRSGLERVVRLGEALAGCASLAVLGGVVARFVAPEASWVQWLTTPTAMTAALAYGVATLVAARQPAGVAGDPRLRPGLADALQAALGKAPRGDLEAIISGAIDPERITESIGRSLEKDGVARRLEAIAEQIGDQLSQTQPEVDSILEDLVTALSQAKSRRVLARWLGQVLYDERELVTDFGKAVAKKAGPGDPFDLGIGRISRGKMHKAVRKFLDSGKGERWLDDVVRCGLSDLRHQPPRAAALRRALMPEVTGVATHHLAEVIGPRISEALGHESGILDDVAAAVRTELEPALMGALAQAVGAQATAGVEHIDERALGAVVRRAAEPAARRLQLGAFVIGGALGAVPAMWS